MQSSASGPRRRDRLLFGGAALFSGVALLGHILFGVPLPVALALAATTMLTVVAAVLVGMAPPRRAHLGRVVLAGALAGLAATICYDAAKWGLSQLDPSPYNPFEATRAFGSLLVGAEAPQPLIQFAGTAIHLLNGTAFGVAFVTVAGNRGHRVRTAVLLGVAWGLLLELFQLTLYPGWLDIRAYREFATISALSHVVYGATLGLSGRALLRRLLREAPARA